MRVSKDGLPVGVSKLNNRKQKYIARYFNGDKRFSKKFYTLEDAIEQRKEWEEKYGTPKWGGQTFTNLVGQRFGRLKVVEFLGTKNEHGRYKCKCDCGNVTEVITSSLTSGKTRSCGCLHLEVIHPDRLKEHRQKFIDDEVDGVQLIRFTSKANKNNETGYKGVSMSTGGKTYRATITIKGQEYGLYGFKTAKEAYYNGRLVLEEKYLPKRKNNNK